MLNAAGVPPAGPGEREDDEIFPIRERLRFRDNLGLGLRDVRQRPAYYSEFCSGQNGYFANSASSASGDPIFNAAAACYGTLLSWANLENMRSLTWDGAVQEVRQGFAAMTIMGDWALGEFMPDVDFGEVPAPRSADTFIFTTDTFVLPTGAANRDGAIALLSEWGSAAGQSISTPSTGRSRRAATSIRAATTRLREPPSPISIRSPSCPIGHWRCRRRSRRISIRRV
jgi:ABC-type glycerol-3-phosphate transport system substrate-binding protein